MQQTDRIDPNKNSVFSKSLKWVKSLSIATRKRHCPVRAKYLDQDICEVTEYLVPTGELQYDRYSQTRAHGRDQHHVAKLAREMQHDGQDEGICSAVLQDKESNFYLAVRWGNQRATAVEYLDEQGGNSIKGCPTGHIWVNVYDFVPSERVKLQTIENNLGKSKKLNSKEQNVDQLKNALSNGDFDEDGQKFINLSQVKQVEIMTRYIKGYMGSNVPKPAILINEFYSQNRTTLPTDTCSYTEHQDHWNLHESARNLKFEKAGMKNNSIHVATAKYIQCHNNKGFNHGSQVQSLEQHKVDIGLGTIPHPNTTTIMIASAPLGHTSNQTKLDDYRNLFVESVKKLNRQFFKSDDLLIIDELYWMPQTKIEKANAKSGVKSWPKHYKGKQQLS